MSMFTVVHKLVQGFVDALVCLSNMIWNHAQIYTESYFILYMGIMFILDVTQHNQMGNCYQVYAKILL